MKKICFVTGTRADYGLLRWVMEGICKSSLFKLQLVVTGTHLSPEFGLTVRTIESDGFKIDRKVEMLLSSDTPVGTTKSMGLGIIGFADAFAELQPDLMLLIGDRYETFAAASAAMIACIPIAHLHGGETTEGAFDESIRHSITKMSHFHFVAAEAYRQRVIQLGEHPDRVFNVGGLGVDNLLRLKLFTREELEAVLDLKLLRRNLLITFHPVTLEQNAATHQLQELLEALAELENVGLIFTMPNADTEGRVLFQQIQDFCLEQPHAYAYKSLGQTCYLSCVKHVTGVVGNSSSGLTEVPSLKKGTINIGSRQRGRITSDSVINCPPDSKSITKAIKHLFSTEFQNSLLTVKNPYGLGGASEAITKILEEKSTEISKNLLKKTFFNIKFR